MGSVSGSLNGVAFGPSTITISINGDSSTVVSTGFVHATGPCVTGSSLTISIGGASPIAFTSPMSLCVGTSGRFAGVYGSAGATDLLHFDGVLTGLDLRSIVGPLAMTGSDIHQTGGVSHNTSQGPLAIASVALPPVGASLTIAATAAAQTAAIPTLSEWALIGLSAVLAMLGISRMRRQR